MEMDYDQAMGALYAGLAARPRPEDVAAAILRVPALPLDTATKRSLQNLARHSERLPYVSMMADTWEPTVGAGRQLATLATLLQGTPVQALVAACDSGGRMRQWRPA